MEAKKNQYTNRKQFELLVSLMEENPPIAKGQKFCAAMHISKEDYAEFWNNISKRLNSVGPPIRTVAQWQKVWADHRQHVKDKLSHNKKESQATGGGPNKMVALSSSEEAVVRLLALDKTVNHSGSVFGLQSERPTSSQSPPALPSHHEPLPSTSQEIVVQECRSFNENDADLENIENINNDNTRDIRVQPINKNRKRKKEEDDSRLGMLKKQTEYMKRIAEDTREIARYTRKMCKIKEEHYRQKQAYMLEKEKSRYEELQCKKELVAMKMRKLEFLERTT